MAEEAIRCPHCQSETVVKYGRASNGKERYRCQQLARVGERLFGPMRIQGVCPRSSGKLWR